MFAWERRDDIRSVLIDSSKRLLDETMRGKTDVFMNEGITPEKVLRIARNYEFPSPQVPKTLSYKDKGSFYRLSDPARWWRGLEFAPWNLHGKRV